MAVVIAAMLYVSPQPNISKTKILNLDKHTSKLPAIGTEICELALRRE
jgi:hypothetical protein